jgi:hypothetical protein
VTSVSQQATPIPTRYAGCHFRSRLEARWAVFFDALSVEWQYEPEGFELVPFDDNDSIFGPEQGADEHLGYYLPDFKLPTLNAWFEVKGTNPTTIETRKLNRLGQITGMSTYMAWGDIPRNPNSTGHEGDGYPSHKVRDIEIYGDYDYAWCICPWCGKPGIEFDARSARVCGWEAHSTSETEAWAKVRHLKYVTRIDDKCYNGNHARLLEAYAAARSARFEHGHSGAS